MFTRRMVSNVAVLAVLVACLATTRQGLATTYFSDDFNTSIPVIDRANVPSGWVISQSGPFSPAPVSPPEYYTATEASSKLTVSEVQGSSAGPTLSFTHTGLAVSGDFMATYKFSWAQNGINNRDGYILTMTLVGSAGDLVVTVGDITSYLDGYISTTINGATTAPPHAYPAQNLPQTDAVEVDITRVGTNMTMTWTGAASGSFSLITNTTNTWASTITGVKLDFTDFLPHRDSNVVGGPYATLSMSPLSVDLIDISTIPVPEPASLALISLGGLMILRRRRAA